MVFRTGTGDNHGFGCGRATHATASSRRAVCWRSRTRCCLHFPKIDVRHRSGRRLQGVVRGVERPLPIGAERLEHRAAPRRVHRADGGPMP